MSGNNGLVRPESSSNNVCSISWRHPCSRKALTYYSKEQSTFNRSPSLALANICEPCRSGLGLLGAR